MDDLISKQAALDAPKAFIKDCNPEHFVGHSNFIEYMDTVGIRSFGNWQYANGFNMGLTAAEVAIEKLPSAQQSRLENAIHGKSPEEIYEFIIWLFFRYAKQFTDSRLAIIDWLKGEDDPSHPFADSVMMKGESGEESL